MATRRRKRRRNTSVRRTVRAANPRRRRRSVRRRRHNPVVARRRRSNPRRTAYARAANPRRRHYRRRSNPSAMRIGEILKDMVYGAGGAILTRVGEGIVSGFVPGSFAGQPYTKPIVQGAVAVFGVRLLGKKFLGQKQGDLMMLGGLISAGLALADNYLPNIQNQLSGIIRLPMAAPAQLPAVVPVTGSGLGDVYDVDMVAAGFGDVEEVPMGIWS